jgi:programmed cell death 6-interacting protein
MQAIQASQFEDLFEEQLKHFDSDRDMIAQERRDQDTLSDQVREANRAFTGAHKGDASTKEREIALQDLENGYLKYKEVISNLEVGRKFYNDLAKIVARFRDDAKAFVHQRRMEASQLETYVPHALTISDTGIRILTSRSDISNAQAMSSLHISQPHLRQQPQQSATSTYTASPPSQLPSQPPTAVPTARPVDPAPPLTAPQPVRAPVAPPPVSTPGMPGMWSPEMGIRFGSAAIPPGANPASAAAPAPSQAVPKPRGPQPGTWDPSQGLRFS